MKLRNLTIHNFRSIKHQELQLSDYSMLIGANNSGKTNVIDALRIFFEKDLKFNRSRDLPIIAMDDEESWIELTFWLSEEEHNCLPDKYKQGDQALRIRKYLQSSATDRVKANQSNLYAYEKEVLSDSLFFGAKNISEAKLGSAIYVPEVARIDDITKLSGPSAFRDSLNFVVKKVVKNSAAFDGLSNAFADFNNRFKDDSSKDGLSIQKFLDDVNREIGDWEVRFDVEINNIKPEDIIKNQLAYHLRELSTREHKQELTSFGQGLQRHLIYILITLSAKYAERSGSQSKQEFAPDFNLILFEEPEAFLHPAQQEVMHRSFREISTEENQQVIITTHSSHFASKNMEDLPATMRLCRECGETRVYSISVDLLDDILRDNQQQLAEILQQELTVEDIGYESLRYCLWMDPDRCCAFFADIVLICEGLTEKALINHLISERKVDLGNIQVYVLDAGGKHNLHRYMRLLGSFGIRHSVIFDSDNNARYHAALNEFIVQNRNPFTLKMHSIDEGTIEDFLGIQQHVADKYRKALHALWAYKNGTISADRISALVELIEELVTYPLAGTGAPTGFDAI